MFTLNLRCYLIVVFCLISPDFTTSSFAMHKHLVSVVFKRLTNFASLALSTLVRMNFVVGGPLIGVAALSLALPIDIYRSFSESKIRFILFLTDRFLIFHKKLPKNFCSKRWIFKWSFCTIKNVTLSVCLNVMHITWDVEKKRQCEQKWVLMQLLIGGESFSWIYCRKMSKNRFPLPLSTLPKTFHPVAQKNLSGFRGAHWIAWRSSWELFRVRLGRGWVVRPRYILVVEQHFWNCLCPVR